MQSKIAVEAAVIAVLIVLFISADALSGTTTYTSSSTAVNSNRARNRLGKASFLHKKEHGTLPQSGISSSKELQNLAKIYGRRQVGSKNFHKGWKSWSKEAIDSIQYDLSLNLPHPADKRNFERLFFNLGVAADQGQMPSFEDAGARSGYALEFFCRARNLADLFLDSLNPSFLFEGYWLEAMIESPMLGCSSLTNDQDDDTTPYQMVSLGGGPGFDYVGAVLSTSFASNIISSSESGTTASAEGESIFNSSNTRSSRELNAIVLDYEEGWQDLVETMNDSTNRILRQTQHSCQWGGKCDITKPLNDPSNVACKEVVISTDLWTCQYCVAENANRLRESKYIFFRDLFQYAKDGSTMILTETHPRIWPEFHRFIQEYCPYMQMSFNKNGRQLLIRKMFDSEQTPIISKQDEKLLIKFENMKRDHERKLNSGWTRQSPKIRGHY